MSLFWFSDSSHTSDIAGGDLLLTEIYSCSSHTAGAPNFGRSFSFCWPAGQWDTQLVQFPAWRRSSEDDPGPVQTPHDSLLVLCAWEQQAPSKPQFQQAKTYLKKLWWHVDGDGLLERRPDTKPVWGRRKEIRTHTKKKICDSVEISKYKVFSVPCRELWYAEHRH